MKLRLPNTRWTRIALALAGIGVATSIVIGNEPEPPRASPTAEARPARATSASSEGSKKVEKVDLAALSRPLGVELDDKLFYIPPPPAPPPAPRAAVPVPTVAEAPPPKPVAPPLPFKFMGRLIDKGTTTVFVSHNGESLTLKQGEKAVDLYRVEQITQSEVVFLYEPLAERQVLAIGAVN